jgi:hypothetical protein
MKDVVRVRSSQSLGPNPYAGSGDTSGVAWGTGTCRPAIELRNQPFRVPTWSDCGEGNTQRRALASGVATRRSQRPCACMETQNARTGRSHMSSLYGGAVGEGPRPYVNVNACGKSDGPIVPTKRANKTGTPGAESAEERGSLKGKALDTNRFGHSAGQSEDGSG